MKTKYTIVARYTFEPAGCNCCTDTMLDSYEIYSGDTLVDGGFLSSEDALVALLELYNVEVSFE